MFILREFILHMSVIYPYVDNISHFELSSLFLTDKTVSRVFWCAPRFLLFEKMDLRNCIKFCVKNEIKCSKTFDMLTVNEQTQAQLWYDRYKKAEKIAMTMLVLKTSKL